MGERSGGVAEGLSFWKVEGAGNDFVLLDYREKAGPRLTAGVVRYLLDRHRGIGADGLLLLRKSSGGLVVEYRNADGSPAEFCGNGARCAAAHIMGGSSDRIQFRLMKIPIVAVRTDRAIAVQVGPAEERRMPNLSRLRPRPAALIHAGVDHWIVPVGDVQAVDVVGLGMTLRHHPWPGTQGANVTFVERRRAEIRIRTLERGVEGETLSCGSGCVAAAHWVLEGSPGPMTVSTRGGDLLRVWKDAEEMYWLEGPTRVVFTGTWPLRALGTVRPRAAKSPAQKG